MKARYRCLGCSFQSCEGTLVRVAVYGNGVTACAAKAFETEPPAWEAAFSERTRQIMDPDNLVADSCM